MEANRQSAGTYVEPEPVLSGLARFLMVFLMGLVPVACLLIFGTIVVPNLAVLEAASFDTVITVLLIALIVSLPTEN